MLVDSVDRLLEELTKSYDLQKEGTATLDNKSRRFVSPHRRHQEASALPAAIMSRFGSIPPANPSSAWKCDGIFRRVDCSGGDKNPDAADGGPDGSPDAAPMDGPRPPRGPEGRPPQARAGARPTRPAPVPPRGSSSCRPASLAGSGPTVPATLMGSSPLVPGQMSQKVPVPKVAVRAAAMALMARIRPEPPPMGRCPGPRRDGARTVLHARPWRPRPRRSVARNVRAPRPAAPAPAVSRSINPTCRNVEQLRCLLCRHIQAEQCTKA